MTQSSAARVLIVEDEDEMVTKFTPVLIEAGFSVDYLKSASELFSFLAKNRPDIILLDLMLPDEHGFSVLKKLQQSEKTKTIPVLILTNLAEEVGFDRAIEEGAVGYIQKTLRTPEQVVMLIKHVLMETSR